MPRYKTPYSHQYGPYPFRSMKGGESIFIPCVEGDTPERLLQQVSNATRYWRNRRSVNFISRIRGNGVRVWAVEPYRLVSPDKTEKAGA